MRSGHVDEAEQAMLDQLTHVVKNFTALSKALYDQSAADTVLHPARSHRISPIDLNIKPPAELQRNRRHSDSNIQHLTPLAILRLKKAQGKNQRVLDARASTQQRLRDRAATKSFKQLPGNEQAAQWCGKEQAEWCSPLDLAGLSEDYAEASRAYARFGRTAQNDAPLQDCPPAHKPRPGAVRHLGVGERFIAASLPDFASVDLANSLLFDRELPL
ncbi:hypothetical protein T484DRAFT_1794377 [Baffinella frigidus]|nr:hypothetical protein T484DRAFT_1794377 [Cryptophyta sp. CCMP2293]